MRRRWDAPGDELPKRPYRDSAILHIVLSLAILVVAFATGGSMARAAVVAAAYFGIATAWSWLHWYRRLRDPADGPRRGRV